MANTANYPDGRQIYADSLTRDEFLAFKQKVKKEKIVLSGNFCNHTLLLRRASSRARQHFAHYPSEASCVYNSAGESDAHLGLKIAIKNEAVRQGYKAFVEKRLNENAISDVSILGEKHIVVEVQLASQTDEKYVARTEHRNAAKTSTVWLTTGAENLSIKGVDAYLIKNLSGFKKVKIDNKIEQIRFDNVEELVFSVGFRTHVIAYGKESLEEKELDIVAFVKDIMSSNPRYITLKEQLDMKENRRTQRILSRSGRVTNNQSGSLPVGDFTNVPSVLEYLPESLGSDRIARSIETGEKVRYINTLDRDYGFLEGQTSPVFKSLLIPAYNNQKDEEIVASGIPDINSENSGALKETIFILPQSDVVGELAFSSNQNCSCVKHKPVTDYSNMHPLDSKIYKKTEDALIAAYGEKWCHRDDPNPFRRLVRDDLGKHREIGEMVKYGHFIEVELIPSLEDSNAISMR
jgi:hypothetical protein